MYLRADHAEHHVPALRQFIQNNPLGILTTAIPSPNHPLLQCSHIPWVLDVDDPSSETELGHLRGHMARANPHSKAMMEALSDTPTGAKTQNLEAGPKSHMQLQGEVMILFNGPAHHYVTPKFYVATKPATGKVVPTWNYSAVQVYGTATVYFSPSNPATDAFLMKQLADLSQLAEVGIMDYSERPWSVAEAPERYLELKRKGIMGIEVRVERLEGKFKMSQDLGDGDRKGVVDGFEALGSEVGRIMSQTIKERAAIKEEMRRRKEKEAEAAQT